MFSPDAPASADVGCRVTHRIPLEKEVFHTGQTTRLPREGSRQAGSRIGMKERGLKASGTSEKTNKRKEKTFSPVGEQKEDKNS